MWFKISPLLLFILPFLVNSNPSPTDLNNNHVVKRGLMESFSSNPRIVSVFSSRNAGKTLMQKFLGDNYNSHRISAGNGHIVTIHFPNRGQHSSGESSDDSSESSSDDSSSDSSEEIFRPDCVNLKRPKVIRPKVIRPKVIRPKVIRPKVIRPKVVKPKVIKSESTRPKVTRPTVDKPKDVVPAVIVNNSKVKLPSAGTLEEIKNVIINQNVEKVESEDHMIKIPKLEYKPPNLNYDLEYKVNQIFPPPSGTDSYSIKKETSFSSITDSVLTRMKETDSKNLQANSMSLANNQNTITNNNFLSNPDPKNPPAPFEQQPNLLLINDWLEMNKKVYDTLKPEEKRRLHEANEAVVAKARREGYNPDNQSSEVAFKLLKDQYLITKKKKNDRHLDMDIDLRMENENVEESKHNKIEDKNNTSKIYLSEENKYPNKDIHIISKFAKIIPPPIKTEDNKNIFNKNTNDKDSSSKFVFVTNVTTDESNSDGFIIRKNDTETLVEINKTPITNKNSSSIHRIIKTEHITKTNNDDVGPFYVVQSRPGSSTKTIKKTEYVSDNQVLKFVPETGNDEIFDRFQDNPWISESENLVDTKIKDNHEKNVKISKLVQPSSADGVKVFTSVNKNKEDNSYDTKSPIKSELHISSKDESVNNKPSSVNTKIVTNGTKTNNNKVSIDVLRGLQALRKPISSNTEIVTNTNNNKINSDILKGLLALQKPIGNTINTDNQIVTPKSPVSSSSSHNLNDISSFISRFLQGLVEYRIATSKGAN